MHYAILAVYAPEIYRLMILEVRPHIIVKQLYYAFYMSAEVGRMIVIEVNFTNHAVVSVRQYIVFSHVRLLNSIAKRRMRTSVFSLPAQRPPTLYTLY